MTTQTTEKKEAKPVKTTPDKTYHLTQLSRLINQPCGNPLVVEGLRLHLAPFQKMPTCEMELRSQAIAILTRFKRPLPKAEDNPKLADEFVEVSFFVED